MSKLRSHHRSVETRRSRGADRLPEIPGPMNGRVIPSPNSDFVWRRLLSCGTGGTGGTGGPTVHGTLSWPLF